jgi:hypothetical protein
LWHLEAEGLSPPPSASYGPGRGTLTAPDDALHAR